MSPDFENMLRLFGCGALGIKANAENCVNLRVIREKAISQNVWPIVYSAVRPLIENGEVKLPPDIYSELESAHLANVMKNVQHVEFTSRTLEKLVQSKIECCLIKGTTLACLYAEPDLRISGDTDILIPIEKEKETMKLLESIGYTVEERGSHEHHFEAIHPVGGVLEAHVYLIQKNVSDMAFYNKVEYKEPYLTAENGVKTLGITDGLIFTAVHFIKHFVKSGAGVRHMMDLLLYMKKYDAQINWSRFDSLMKELRYEKLIDAVKTVGLKYWGMDFEGFTPVDDAVIKALLTDIEEGGVFGGEENRKEAFRIFSKRRSDKTEAEFRIYSINHFDKTLFRKIFPEKKSIKKIYPDAENSTFRLCCAYVKRWGALMKDAISGKRSINEYMFRETAQKNSEQVLQRLSLMEKLDIIDEEKISK